MELLENLFMEIKLRIEINSKFEVKVVYICKICLGSFKWNLVF